MQLETGPNRLTQVFEYLKALNQHRNPTTRQVSDQGWLFWWKDIPNTPAVKIGLPLYFTDYEHESSEEDSSEYLLKVRRPKLTNPPSPPESIQAWIEEGWTDPSKDIQVKDSIEKTNDSEETILIHFGDDPKRTEDLEKWKEKRDKWVEITIPALQAMDLFEHLYELYGRLQKESERYELILGDGILNWYREDGGINHPLILQRIHITFDPNVPEFTISETDQETELYSSLFHSIPEANPKYIAQCTQELSSGHFHPLGGIDTSGFLRRFVVQLDSKGQFIDEGPLEGEEEYPRISRNPVIFMRRRTLGYTAAIESIIEELKSNASVPDSLLNIVGIETQGPDVLKESNVSKELEHLLEPEDVLLGKVSNPEQIQIARNLDNYPGVLVQGPPGTGKTHTIANLIGHLLANGKSVLVTSHTSKALRVLRQQVEEQIRPLCVSVLNNDSESQDQLKDSIENIVSKLSSSNQTRMERDINDLTLRRKELINNLNATRVELRDALANEYRDIVIAGQSYNPVTAAKMIYSERGINDWIPLPVKTGVLPLGEDDFKYIYKTNELFSIEDEQEYNNGLIDPSNLPSPEQFQNNVSTIREIAMASTESKDGFWKQCGCLVTSDEIQSILEKVDSAAKALNIQENWHLAVLESGMEGEVGKKPWITLIEKAHEVKDFADQAKESLIEYQPEVKETEGIDSSTLSEIINHLSRGHSLNWLSLTTHPAWKKLVSTCTISGNPPKTLEHFQALFNLVRLKELRTKLASRWDLQMSNLGAPTSDQFSENLEVQIVQLAKVIERDLKWYEEIWKPIENKLDEIGFDWEAFMAEQPLQLGKYPEITKLAKAIEVSLINTLESQQQKLLNKELETYLSNLCDLLSVKTKKSNLVSLLLTAIKSHNSDEYEKAYNYVKRLWDMKDKYTVRQELIQKLEQYAPKWAEAIQSRKNGHNQSSLPGDLHSAWRYAQLHFELKARSEISLVKLQDKIDELNRDLKNVTNQLIQKRAWLKQLERVSLPEQQALVGYLDVVKRIGRGKGKRASRLKAEARNKMRLCKSAVPVWIMPLSRVAETFDPKDTKFDVVIIDEASQCDVMGMIALYMGSKVLIVGDNEQVSPLAIGQKLDIVQKMIDQHLQGIPNKDLYDGTMSVYDLARQSFASPICLVEHFRCVPEIIQFSNHLSYNGKIKPLRDSSSSKLKPPVISYRVDGAESNNKINRKEAIEVASLVLAATQIPDYDGKTFGVISLLGEEQAILIDSLLRKNLSEKEYSKREIICGTAAQFQGDERDVIFLSVVDGPTGSPLQKRSAGYQDMFKKRYNVAASRAKDQMWVVHSLNYQTDLKPGDLRRRLIEFAEDPDSIDNQLKKVQSQAESPFEEEVLGYLVRAGYKVTPQWNVGYYRIDMVVEGNGNKLAIECDGERYHPLEKIGEDMARQAILERLGWTFYRIRGSQYFRNPQEAMNSLFERLAEMGIEPSQTSSPSDLAKNDSSLRNNVVLKAQEIRELLNNGERISTNENIDVTLLDNAPEEKREHTTDRSGLCIPDDTGRAESDCDNRPSNQAPNKEKKVNTIMAKNRRLKKDTNSQKSSNDLINWVGSHESSTWFKMSRWARENDALQPWERSLLYSLGKLKSSGRQASEKQAKHGKRLYNKLLELGFDPEQQGA